MRYAICVKPKHRKLICRPREVWVCIEDRSGYRKFADRTLFKYRENAERLVDYRYEMIVRVKE